MSLLVALLLVLIIFLSVLYVQAPHRDPVVAPTKGDPVHRQRKALNCPFQKCSAFNSDTGERRGGWGCFVQLQL